MNPSFKDEMITVRTRNHKNIKKMARFEIFIDKDGDIHESVSINGRYYVKTKDEDGNIVYMTEKYLLPRL